MTVKAHYEQLLAGVYSWMHGDFQERMQEHMTFFRKNSILPERNIRAYDLGAGHGIQTVALANLGFEVTAVDFNKHLLDQLRSNSNGLPVVTIESDIINYIESVTRNAGVIICMGDTLTHLNDRGVVDDLIGKISQRLTKNGKVILSYRDLNSELHGNDRFIHLRSDDSRSMICFLEYFPNNVIVHDILVEKTDGIWKQKVSSYPKLRLPVRDVLASLKKHQINILHEEVIRGMIYIIGQRF